MKNEEKQIAELTDEEIDKAAGGSAPALGKKEKLCVKCGEKLPYNYLGFLCKKCRGSDSGIPGINFPLPR